MDHLLVPPGLDDFLKVLEEEQARGEPVKPERDFETREAPEKRKTEPASAPRPHTPLLPRNSAEEDALLLKLRKGGLPFQDVAVRLERDFPLVAARWSVLNQRRTAQSRTGQKLSVLVTPAKRPPAQQSVKKEETPQKQQEREKLWSKKEDKVLRKLRSKRVKFGADKMMRKLLGRSEKEIRAR
ncbi:hypothetical protein JCM8547_005400 [Rhodosporidiobolus lusitaniae]